MRILFAFIIAPLVPAALHIIYGVVMSLSWPFNSTDIQVLVGVSSGVSLLGLTFLGIPLVVLLKRINRLKKIYLIILSFILGGIIILILDMYNYSSVSDVSPVEYVYHFGYGGILAVSVAVTFMLVSGITSPKRTE